MAGWDRGVWKRHRAWRGLGCGYCDRNRTITGSSSEKHEQASVSGGPFVPTAGRSGSMKLGQRPRQRAKATFSNGSYQIVIKFEPRPLRRRRRLTSHGARCGSRLRPPGLRSGHKHSTCLRPTSRCGSDDIIGPPVGKTYMLRREVDIIAVPSLFAVRVLSCR